MENVFEKQGIQFKIIEKEMYAAVLDFLWDNFMPDEPINRSLGTTRNWVVDDYYFTEAMKDGCSIAALDMDRNIVVLG